MLGIDKQAFKHGPLRYCVTGGQTLQGSIRVDIQDDIEPLAFTRVQMPALTRRAVGLTLSKRFDKVKGGNAAYYVRPRLAVVAAA